MKITIDIPDADALVLQNRVGDLAKWALSYATNTAAKLRVQDVEDKIQKLTIEEKAAVVALWEASK